MKRIKKQKIYNSQNKITMDEYFKEITKAYKQCKVHVVHSRPKEKLKNTRYSIYERTVANNLIYQLENPVCMQ